MSSNLALIAIVNIAGKLKIKMIVSTG
uniref:Uncharacterized protein n=1 Tax=Rhizophora mucronata TaxID=61149 RepID=A0A2P2NDM3_RHIMU